MIIGIPKEIKTEEYRVALTPAEVIQLVPLVQQVLIQKDAGTASGYADSAYRQSGATIINSAEEIWAQADLIIKVKEPQPCEYRLMQCDQIIFTYFHFASSAELIKSCLKAKITALAYETLQNSQGQLPLLAPMSAVAGKLAAHQGAKYLEKTFAGKGILMGGLDIGCSHADPATVIILGGGVVGTHAAQTAAQMGARVSILEINPDRIKQLKQQYQQSPIEVVSAHRDSLKELIQTADVIIGAVLVAGAKAPLLLSREDLSLMQPGTVLVDVAIDQGGCFATSRATTHNNPVYVIDDIVHYCVANLPGAVCRTSSQALAAATISYIKQLAESGLDAFLQQSSGQQLALNMRHGKLTHPALISTFSDLADDI